MEVIIIFGLMLLSLFNLMNIKVDKRYEFAYYVFCCFAVGIPAGLAFCWLK